MAPLSGEIYNSDTREVHTYISKFIEGNSTAEAKVRSHSNQVNGCKDCIYLRNHYEGTGFYSVAITKAEYTNNHLFYSCEKFSMNWTIFETELDLACSVIDKREG